MRLRILCGLFVIPTLTVVAQQQPAAPSGTGNPAMNQAIQRMLHPDSSKQPLFSPGAVAATLQAPAVCSVPLLEMAIPKDVNFTMLVIHPRQEAATDKFGNVPMPAPPCNHSASEGRIAAFPFGKR